RLDDCRRSAPSTADLPQSDDPGSDRRRTKLRPALRGYVAHGRSLLRVRDGFMGGPGRYDGWTGGRAAGGTRFPRRAGAGRDDECVWDVQRAGDELLAPA